MGRSLVERFEREGRPVSVLARRAPEYNNQAPASTRYWPVDITDGPALKVALSNIIGERGKLQSLVFLQRHRAEGDSWEGEQAVSVTATRDVIEHLAGQFDSGTGGSVVIVNSNASEIIVDEQPLAYHTAKAALLQLVRYYAVQLGPRQVRVNGVCPITTIKPETREFHREEHELRHLYQRIIPLGRLGTSEEIANVISFLCSSEASFITGQNLTVDGGISLRGHEALARLILK